MTSHCWSRLDILRLTSTVVPRSCELARRPSAGAAFLLVRRNFFWTSAGLMAESTVNRSPVAVWNSADNCVMNAAVAGNAYRRSFGSFGLTVRLSTLTSLPSASAASMSARVRYRGTPILSARSFSRRTLSCVARKKLGGECRAQEGRLSSTSRTAVIALRIDVVLPLASCPAS